LKRSSTKTCWNCLVWAYQKHIFRNNNSSRFHGI
jgi:hypothetical protein